jgi:hypothetical protein
MNRRHRKPMHQAAVRGFAPKYTRSADTVVRMPLEYTRHMVWSRHGSEVRRLRLFSHRSHDSPADVLFAEGRPPKDRLMP